MVMKSLLLQTGSLSALRVIISEFVIGLDSKGQDIYTEHFHVHDTSAREGDQVKEDRV